MQSIRIVYSTIILNFVVKWQVQSKVMSVYAEGTSFNLNLSSCYLQSINWDNSDASMNSVGKV